MESSLHPTLHPRLTLSLDLPSRLLPNSHRFPLSLCCPLRKPLFLPHPTRLRQMLISLLLLHEVEVFLLPITFLILSFIADSLLNGTLLLPSLRSLPRFATIQTSEEQVRLLSTRNFALKSCEKCSILRNFDIERSESVEAGRVVEDGGREG